MNIVTKGLTRLILAVTGSRMDNADLMLLEIWKHDAEINERFAKRIHDEVRESEMVFETDGGDKPAA